MKIGVSLAGYPWAPNPDGWDKYQPWISRHCDQVGFPMPYWSELEPTLGQWNTTAFAGLDRIVNEARAAGLKVLLYMTGWPGWVTAEHRARCGGKQSVSPDNLNPGSPWAYYLRRVLERYAGRVEWVVPLNEPNFAFMNDPTTMARDTAVMMRIAADVAQSVPGSPMLLMPGVLDADIGGQSNWRWFTEQVLAALKGWRPAVRVGWAHHPYTDVREGNASRTQKVLDLLEKYGWHDGRRVYLTEGAYRFDVRQVGPNGSNNYEYSDPMELQTQSSHLAWFYAWATGRADPKVNGQVVLGQQWVLQDPGVGRWMSGLVSPDGTGHPIVPWWELARPDQARPDQARPSKAI